MTSRVMPCRVPVFILLSLLAVTRAAADGCFIPEKLYKTPVAIPSQRALLVFRDNAERLIVESRGRGEGDSFAWIVPVPAVPTEFSATTPALLDALSEELMPEFRDSDASESRWLSLAVVCGIVVAVWLVTLFIYAPDTRMAAAEWLAPIVVLSIPFIAIAALSGTRGGGFPATAAEVGGATVLRREVVGSYEVVTLTARTAGDLNAWLDANDFASIPAKGDAIVADYIDDGWVFVAAKLRRNGMQFLSPHPISIGFPATRPVYPMRLTALAESEVDLDLFVAAPSGMNRDPLRLEYRDQWSALSRGVLAQLDTAAAEAARHAFWQGCVLTRLTGVVPPADMTEDFVLTPTRNTPYRPTLYTEGAALRLAWLRGLWFWNVAAVVAVLLFWRRISTAKSLTLAFSLVVGPAAILAAALVLLTLYTLPRLEERGYEIRPDEEFRRTTLHFVSEAGEPDRHLLVVSDAYAVRDLASLMNLSGRPAEETAQVLRDFYTYTLVFAANGRRLRLGNRPDQLEILVDQRGCFARYHFPRMGFRDVVISGQGATASRVPDLGIFLTTPEDFDRLAADLSKEESTGYFVEPSVFACVKVPEQCIPAFLKDIEKRRTEQPIDLPLLELEASALGLALRIAPPDDVTDRSSMHDFLQRIRLEAIRLGHLAPDRDAKPSGYEPVPSPFL